jgi:hypothetical protein
MLETAADQHAEVLEESCIHLSVEYQHEKKEKGLIKYPIGVSTVLEDSGQTRF